MRPVVSVPAAGGEHGAVPFAFVELAVSHAGALVSILHLLRVLAGSPTAVVGQRLNVRASAPRGEQRSCSREAERQTAVETSRISTPRAKTPQAQRGGARFGPSRERKQISRLSKRRSSPHEHRHGAFRTRHNSAKHSTPQSSEAEHQKTEDSDHDRQRVHTCHHSRQTRQRKHHQPHTSHSRSSPGRVLCRERNAFPKKTRCPLGLPVQNSQEGPSIHVPHPQCLVTSNSSGQT